MDIGALFDWDGVVIDSRINHEAAWERLAQEEGKPLVDDHFERGFGMKNEWILPNILGWTDAPHEIRRLSLRKEELYREAIRDTGVPIVPGTLEFLRELRLSGVPCAIGSSTQRANIDVVFQETDLGSFFRSVITAEDVSLGKPDPEVYLLAARSIEIAPERCVVFEDVPVGIQAAKRGGMRAVAVATTHPRETLHEADRVVERLDQVSVDELAAMLAA